MKPEQITAWALDEASAEERQQLEAALLDNPQTKQTAEETKEFCDFLLTELRDDSLALTDAQRERLKAQPTAADVRPDGLKPELRTSWRTGMIRLALAACVVLGAFLTWNQFDRENAQELAQLPLSSSAPVSRLLATKDGVGTRTEGDGVEFKKMPEPVAQSLDFDMGRTAAAPSAGKAGDVNRLGRLKLGSGDVAFQVMPSPMPGIVGVGAGLDQQGAGTSALSGPNTYTGGITLNGGGVIAAPAPTTAPTVVTIGGVVSTSGATAGPVRGDFRSFEPGAKPVDAAVPGKNESPLTAMTPPPVTLGMAQKNGVDLMTAPVVTTKAGTQATAVVTGDLVTSRPSSPMVPNPTGASADGVAKGLLLAGSSAEIGNYNAAISQYQDVLRTDPYNAAARRGIEAVEKKRVEYFHAAADHSRGKLLARVNEDWEDKVPRSDIYYFGRSPDEKEMPAFRPQLDSRSNTETYTRILENELKDVAREPLSTFSIDVDTAAYANVRRFLNQNTIPPPDAVRIEELVNYFPTAEEGPAHDAKEPFAVRVEMAPCPWQPAHRLARIAIKGRELGNERKNSNLVFLVDVSGSMNEPNKLPLVQQSLRMLTEQLGEGDRVTMVVYAGSSGLVLPPTNGEKKADILAAIDKLKAGGSTHGSAGIQLAYEQAVAGFIKEGVNRVILCTDGDFNVGVSSPEALETLIMQKAKSGVFLSVLGFGSGNLKDRTMETLADKGNGNYAYIDSLSEARKVLVEQMSGTLVTIAKDVKIQVEFNPAAVRSYRLIGYENRMLAKEDFNDDMKDAGEIGAGHSVVALYEVVPANLPPGAEPRPAVDSLKYQAAAIAPAQLADAAKSGETMTVKLRYKEPEGETSQLIEVPTKDEGKTLTASSEEFKYSAAVAGFGLLLRDSAYKGTLSWETVRRLAIDGKGADKLGYRGEFLQLIDKARGLKETRP